MDGICNHSRGSRVSVPASASPSGPRGSLPPKPFKVAEEEAGRVVKDAERRSETLLREAEIEGKDLLFRMKSEFEAETKETRSVLKTREQRLLQKEENVDRKLDQFEKRDHDFTKKENQLQNKIDEVEKKENEYQELVEEQKNQLEKISGLTAEQAKNLLVRAMENEARYEGAKLIKRIQNESREEADKKAKEIIATAIQRYAGDYVAERTVSVVQLPGDEMKGRIIGREGRNIRALEAATGIDLIIDDTPEAVILSGFNPVRREVARLSLMRLISDGRIHPARIEDVVRRVEKEVDDVIKEAGEQAAFDLGIHGMNNKLVRHLGKLKFRTSYAQNVLQHSIEVGIFVRYYGRRARAEPEAGQAYGTFA
jgi:ribonuclease Y